MGRAAGVLRTRVASVVAGAVVLSGLAAGTGEASPTPDLRAPWTGVVAATEPADEISVLMSGDMLVHSTLTAQARRDATAGGPSLDFYPMLRAQRPRVSGADLAICHLETPIAQPGGPYTGYPAFKAPAHVVTAIRRVGYDACTTASNHSLDDGTRGVRRTLEVLDGNGIEHTGTARSSTERDRPLIKTVKGVQVGIVSATFGTNGIPVPRDKPWSVNLISRSRLLADVTAARRAGAEIVVVAVHAGTEYQHSPSAQQREVARYLVGSRDVDAVYFHHAHVAQPIEKTSYRWVAWGLGNSFATSTTRYNASTGEQLMVRFTFGRRWDGRWVVKKTTYVPGYSPDVAPYRWVDLATSSQDPRLSATTRAAYDRRRRHLRSIVDMRGGLADGVSQVWPISAG